ncbi:hypothetical protein GGR51DRAFT_530147 [Nemania sp. FL0031]|nr:hypothetical protein GGR51DRAFT_530147 [Nemania sp. FL0031]
MEGLSLMESYDAPLVIRQFLSEAPQNNQKPDERTLTARLCGENLELFREILKISTREGYQMSESELVSLERSFGRLKLWSDGYGVAAGHLDEVFTGSRMLRISALKLLGSLATTLTDRLVPRLTGSSGSTQEPLSTCILEVKSLLERIETQEDESSSSNASYEFESDSVDEIAQDLLTDTLCLMELDPLLKNPILDQRDDEKVALYDETTNWDPHYLYCERVRSRFPQATNPLIFRLGKANFERYIRCQDERVSQAGVTANDAEDALLAHYHASSVDGSKFYDSALGSSLPSTSNYAETIMSYGGTKGHSVRVPPLPPQGKTGDPFLCVACGRSVRISNNSAWKQHLYADLRPWLCLHPYCSHGDNVYKNRTDWISHLALDHHLAPAWESMECPLCLESTGAGKITIIKHLGSHLEEISLGALPSGLEFDAESEDEGRDAEDYHSNAPSKPNLDSDLMNVPTDSDVRQKEPGHDPGEHGKYHGSPKARQWDLYKDTILQLYKENTLATVRKIMIERYNFKATTRAYRQRLTKWGVRKYNINSRSQDSASRPTAADDKN